jgi:hypothetical protein
MNLYERQLQLFEMEQRRVSDCVNILLSAPDTEEEVMSLCLQSEQLNLRMDEIQTEISLSDERYKRLAHLLKVALVREEHQRLVAAGLI